MKTPLLPLCVICLLSAGALPAQQISPTAGERPPVTQILTNQPPVTGSHDTTLVADEQKLYASLGDAMIAPEQARAVVDKFKATYGKLGSPRLLFFINRELVDIAAGLQLTKRTEHTETVRGETKSDVEHAAAEVPQTQVNVSVGGEAGATGTGLSGKGLTEAHSEKVTGDNTYEAKNPAVGTLADKQTVRDIERFFGRPFRVAGATLADQKVATSLIADRTVDHSALAGSDLARKDRESLAKVADVVIEVLIASRQITVPQVSGDTLITVPDIQATAIRLSDSAIIGQASSRDVLGRDRDAGKVAQRFDAGDVAEATALALMDDMGLAAK